MKKLLAIILAAALLLSSSCVAAFAAEDDKPAATSGPWDGVWWMTGGAMITIDGTEHHPIYYRQGATETSPIVIDNEAVPGATYDRETNTLTLDNVKLPDDELTVHFMGDDFKLRVVGECELSHIWVRNYLGYHSTSLNITGDGTLTVNEKRDGEAMYFYGDGYEQMHLDIADSVTVHLYAGENADQNFPQNVMRIWSTYADPAITVGGETIPEAKSERWVRTIDDTINAVWIADAEGEYAHGKRVISKEDPEGIYAVTEVHYSAGNGFETRYALNKYNYYDKFGMYLPDPAYINQFGDEEIILTQEELAAGYDYVIAPQPKKIRYTSNYREANRGYRGVKFLREDEPDSVYVADKGWSVPYGNELGGISTYYLYKARWDEDEQLYVVDEPYPSIARGSAEALAEKGYTLATDEGGQRVEVQYIDSKYTYENYSTEAILLTDRNGAPYSAEKWTWDDGRTQYIVDRLEWREDKGHYYAFYDIGELHITDLPYDSLEDIEAAGYQIVLEDQPVDYVTTGKVEMDTLGLYQDEAGNRYAREGSWSNDVYRINEEDTFTYGDKVYTVVTKADDVSVDGLTQVTHEEIRGDYRWWIEGTEYHHIAAEAPDYLLGDVNADGKIDVSDATEVQKIVAELIVPTETQKLAGDVNKDGKVDINDATLIQKYAAEIIDSF